MLKKSSIFLVNFHPIFQLATKYAETKLNFLKNENYFNIPLI